MTEADKQRVATMRRAMDIVTEALQGASTFSLQQIATLQAAVYTDIRASQAEFLEDMVAGDLDNLVENYAG
jgi:hypothetical protein